LGSWKRQTDTGDLALMSATLYGIGIIGLVVLMVYIAYETDFAEDTTIRKEAEAFIFKYNDYGEQIEIFKDPTPPQSEDQYRYEEVAVIAVDEEGNTFKCDEDLKLKDCDGTKLIVGNLTKVSEIITEVQDRQTLKYKVCKLGHQCDIAGKITLINPITKAEIDPPYGFAYVIRCVESDAQNLKIGRRTCDDFEDRTETIISFPDASFLISFTTTGSNPPGIYEAIIKVNSHFTEITPDGREVQLERTAIQEILIVE